MKLAVTAIAGVALLMAAVIGTVTVGSQPPPGGTISSGGGSCGLTDDDPLQLRTIEQQQLARTIARTTLDLGGGRRGVEIALTVALTESGLRNVDYGDMMGPGGTMSSSRGLFQQLNAWGPLADRMNPATATRMFLTGGQAGQPGLFDIDGWETMPIPQAAQAVQRSEFSDGSNFARQMDLGVAVADTIIACDTAVPGGAVLVNGADVTIPTNEFVAPEVRGVTIRTAAPGIAKGIAAGFAQLGLPYVWGGGNNGAPADDGCTRGGGDLNSCQGLRGFDCSGLTAYVIVQGGYPPPGSNSAAQRAAGVDVPWSQGLPGDIIGFTGHVAIYLGTIDGTRYILEASSVGVPVHVKALTRGGYDSVLHRYWTPAAT